MLTEMSTGITTFLFNLIIMQYFGEDGVAAVTIIMYIYYFFIAVYMGIAVAAAPIVSYNVGSGNYEKIKETTRYSFITIAISSVPSPCCMEEGSFICLWAKEMYSI